MKKAIFFDIDGTLIDSANGKCTISESVKNSIRMLQEKGNSVFIATGRPYAYLYDDILNLGFDGFILMNGSLILTEEHIKNSSQSSELHEDVLYKKPFHKDDLRRLIDTFDNTGVQYILQDEKYSYIKEEFEALHDIYRNLNISDKYIRTSYDIDDINIYKMELLYKNDETIELLKSLDPVIFKYTNFKDHRLAEIYSANDSKASGIEKILNHLNIDLKNSYAFGDGYNDVEMLSTAGCGIAMGNAHDSVKAHADKVTLSVENDGVSYGIDKYILNTK